jgi:hypothetical protein
MLSSPREFSSLENLAGPHFHHGMGAFFYFGKRKLPRTRNKKRKRSLRSQAPRGQLMEPATVVDDSEPSPGLCKPLFYGTRDRRGVGAPASKRAARSLKAP